MSQLFHQPHVQSSPMPDFKCTPRLQCMLSASMINTDSRHSATVLLDISEHNMDHITSLERSLCSNFFCCGVQLADLHALLDHFEETHVVVLAPNGKRIYPREGLRAVPLDPISGTTTPSSSRASSVTPASPLTPQTPLSPSPSSPLSPLPEISPPPSRKSSFTVPPVYTPFTPSLPVDPADPILDTSEIVLSQESDFDFSVHPSFFPPLIPESSPVSPSSSEDRRNSALIACSMANGSDHEMDSVSERDSNVQYIASAGGERRRSISKSGKSRRHHPAGGTHSKRREKMYRCPKNGCVKAYLNPNGLKYHLEKGTCRIVDDEDDSMPERSAPLKRSRPASPSTPCAPVSDGTYPSPSVLQAIPKIEERSPVTTINDSGGGVSPISHATSPRGVGPSSSNNYPVMNPAWGIPQVEKQHPHHPVPIQRFKCEKKEDHSTSLPPPAPAVLPVLTPQSLLTQPVPQYMAQAPQQIPFHYPVPSYPTGYLYPQQHRPYFPSDLATCETSASLLANGGSLIPPSSQ